MSSTTGTTILTGSGADAARFSDYWELTKPRLSLMNVITAMLGYFAAGPAADYRVLGALVAGTTLAAFGAGALNMWWERQEDAGMRRTRDRPTVTGVISPAAALWTGIGLGIAGVGVLALGVNLTASALTAATIILYIFAYTPLKKITPWSTEIGAIPGALPPLIGWVAAGAGFSGLGWILFAFLFAWQIPHFMAICWTCREDYREAGFKMLSLVDPSGHRVAVKAFIWSVLMVVISFLPYGTDGLGWLFLVATSILAVVALQPAIAFLSRNNRDANARRVFFTSIIYLPAYLMVLVVDRFLI